ncbi:MAG: FHA domain-containing protein [Lachnospirales bacterium]
MAIVKCGHGHYYDDEKYDICPMCQEADNRKNIDEKTMAFYAPDKSFDDEKTIGINFKKNNCDPVAGWLVCTEGPEKGRDFRIHAGRNFIGRDFSNDIVLTGDKSIGRNNEGCIVYEPHKNIFIIMNDQGASISVNGDVITKPVVITEEDLINIGQYKFSFVAYCKGDKKW